MFWSMVAMPLNTVCHLGAHCIMFPVYKKSKWRARYHFLCRKQLSLILSPHKSTCPFIHPSMDNTFHAHTQWQASSISFFFITKFSIVKYDAHVWNRHGNYIKVSSNMPRLGPLVLEIACGIFLNRHSILYSNVSSGCRQSVNLSIQSIYPQSPSSSPLKNQNI